MESLSIDDLALVISRFTWFHNNRMNRRRGGQKEGCFGCGDPDQFVVNRPKKNKYSSGKHDTSKRKNKGENTLGKYKSREKLN